MSSWKECKLGEIAEVKGGKRLPKGKLLITHKTSHPYIRITDFDGHKINLSAIQYVTEEVQKSISRYIVNKQDIIISNVGTIGLCAKIPDELDNANLTENCVKLVFDKNKIDTNFLFYHLISPDTQDLISGFDVGSTQPKLPIYNVQKIDIVLPPLEEQKEIAEVLSSLDDKIDLLHRQNQTLESLAQTLFRQWFIEEAKEEWEFGTVGDIAILKSGKSRPKEESEINDIPIYGGNGILGFTHQYNVDGETIIIGRVGAYCGSLYIENKPIWVSDNALIAKPQNPLYSKYLFYILKENELNSMAEGSSHPLLTQEPIKSIEIFIPPESKLIEFNEQVNTWYEKINKNKKQIQTLENLRDTLLPKLLSGEIKVKI